MKTKLLSTVLLFTMLSVQVFAQSNMWGLSRNGGNYGMGSIFSMDPSNGSVTVHHSFQSPAGFHPYGNLLQANDGNVYGTCFDGGQFGSCTLFRFEPGNNTYTDVYDFDIINGDFPTSGVIQGPGNMLYGVATYGGVYWDGVLYSWNTFTNTYTVVHSFEDVTGATPYGEPMIHSNGKIYGMTKAGGPSGKGVIYSYDLTTNIYTMLHAFDGTDGSTPYGSLMEASNGLLYGLTSEGGLYQNGVLFSFDPNSFVYTKKSDFSQFTGFRPQGTLLEGSNGILYGTASAGGGPLSAGTLFNYDIFNNILTIIHSFNSTDGAMPIGDLYESGGYLYGTTFSGGTNNMGTAFQIDMWTNSFTKLVDFTAANGKNPTGAFIIVVPTGLQSTHQEEFNIYPNPAEAVMTVNLPDVATSDFRIRVSDVSGKIVMDKSYATAIDHAVDVDLQSLESGMYFLQLETGDRTYKREFVKY